MPLTTPLLVKADGTKFGKTETGTVWLDPDRTSPYAFYQFWINADDRDVGRWLRVFSFLPAEQIEELEAATLERPHAREAQRALAAELTTLVHGQAATDAVVAASAALFGRGDLTQVDPDTLSAALTEAGAVALDRADIDGETGAVPFVTLLARTPLGGRNLGGPAGGDRRRASLNNQRITDLDHPVTAADPIDQRWLVVRKGKRHIAGVDAAELAHAAGPHGRSWTAALAVPT